MANGHPQLVVVEWFDAWTDGTEPVTLADARVEHEPKVITTIGWCLYQDSRGIKIANEHYNDDELYRGQTFIPAGMIKSVTPYVLSKPRKRQVAACASGPDGESS